MLETEWKNKYKHARELDREQLFQKGKDVLLDRIGTDFEIFFTILQFFLQFFNNFTIFLHFYNFLTILQFFNNFTIFFTILQFLNKFCEEKHFRKF